MRCIANNYSIIINAYTSSSNQKLYYIFYINNCVTILYIIERALEFNEPRAATIVTTSFTELLTITKNVGVMVDML